MGTPEEGRHSQDDGSTIIYSHPWNGDLSEVWTFFGEVDPNLGGGLGLNRDGTLRVRTRRGDVSAAPGTWIVRAIGDDFYGTLTADQFAELSAPAPLSPLATEFARLVDRALGSIDEAHVALSGTSIVEDPEVAEFIRALNRG